MSLVKCVPPTGMTAVCITLPSAKIARSVVPPPKSTIATPSSRSSSVSTASLEASGCRMMPITSSSARSTLLTRFWIAVTAPVMMCTLTFRCAPDMASGSRIPSCWSRMKPRGRTCSTRWSGVTMAAARAALIERVMSLRTTSPLLTTTAASEFSPLIWLPAMPT